jgi:hypothetical protein
MTLTVLIRRKIQAKTNKKLNPKDNSISIEYIIRFGWNMDHNISTYIIFYNQYRLRK